MKLFIRLKFTNKNHEELSTICPPKVRLTFWDAIIHNVMMKYIRNILAHKKKKQNE